jgi:hypothetical protein
MPRVRQAVPYHSSTEETTAADIDICMVQTTEEFTQGAAPPMPATACAGRIQRGNDGRLYLSKSTWIVLQDDDNNNDEGHHVRNSAVSATYHVVSAFLDMCRKRGLKK